MAETIKGGSLASEIGILLSNDAGFLTKEEINTPYGKLIPIRGPRVIPPDISIKYINKKAMFYLGDDKVVIYYWGKEYGEDDDYFGRDYQSAKRVYEDVQIPTPKLIDSCDEHMVLITDRKKHDLTYYLTSGDEQEVEKITDKTIDLFRQTWEKTKTEARGNGIPRYVRAFLEPEYPFLKDKHIENYLSDELLSYYQSVQQLIAEYTEAVAMKSAPVGFGLPAVHAGNLVEDDDGLILFVDIERVDAFHWLTGLGLIYQGALATNPDSLFTKTLFSRGQELISQEVGPVLARQLFNLGRMNSLLIACTLRNIVYNSEVGAPIDIDLIRENLGQVSDLLKEP